MTINEALDHPEQLWADWRMLRNAAEDAVGAIKDVLAAVPDLDKSREGIRLAISSEDIQRQLDRADKAPPDDRDQT